MTGLADINSDESIIEQDNRARAERLAIKLARLKNIAVDIEEESRDHIPMLDDVDSNYEKTINALRSGHRKVLTLLRSNRKGRSLFCYTVLLFLSFMIFIYIYSLLVGHQ
jgi:t-SNARE complex subunit (syntaxin)